MTRAEGNRNCAVMIWSGLIVVTALLLSRRVAGGIGSVASVWPSILLSTFTTILSLTGWACFLRVRPALAYVGAESFAACIAWILSWLGGAAVIPTNSTFAQGWLIGVGLLAGSVLGVSGRWNCPGRIKNGLVLARPQTLAMSVSAVPATAQRKFPSAESKRELEPTPLNDEPFSVFDPAVAEDSDGVVTQRMTRQSLPDGVDQIDGLIRVSLATGQRSASIHIPFSPPFASIPVVECEVISDEAARCKVSVVYAYGMRIELKRETTREPGEVELSYAAVCEPADANAA